MKIKLYGLPTCSRCKTAKMMLEKRGIKFEYLQADINSYEDLPILYIGNKKYSAKDALLRIRELK